MAEDLYGNEIEVGDTVKISGASNTYIVSDLHYGGEMADLVVSDYGNDRDGVRVHDLIKVG